MTTEIPKQDLLAKLLKMTTSTNDGEALTAMRKANALLVASGWDWDKLIQGKIRVAADPFSNLAEPYNQGTTAAPRAPARPSAPPPRPTQPPRPQAPPPPKPFEPFSHQSTQGQSNVYPGNCYCCGYSVNARDGKLFVPSHFNRSAPTGKKVICNACDQNRHSFIDKRPAPQPKAQYTGTPNLGDL